MWPLNRLLIKRSLQWTRRERTLQPAKRGSSTCRWHVQGLSYFALDGAQGPGQIMRWGAVSCALLRS